MGEFITCAAIMSLSQGWRVTHCPQDSIDIIAFDDDGLFVRVQVKSSSLRANQSSRRAGYHFQNGSGSSKKKLPDPTTQDIIAHCFLDARRVVFHAAESINQYSQRYSAVYPLRPELEQESWDKAISIIRERQL
jgi:hypothetical protein